MSKKNGKNGKSTKTQAVERSKPIDYVLFVKTWKTATSVKDVAAQLGIKTNSASAIAARLRTKKVNLKRFPRRSIQDIDVKALNKVLSS